MGNLEKPKWKVVVKDLGINVSCFDRLLTSKEVRELIHVLRNALFEFSPHEKQEEP